MTPRRLGISSAAVSIFWSARAIADQESPTPGPGDCGTLALYHLLRLEDRRVDLEPLESILGVPTPEGHSFRELREAAGRVGLKTDAVVLAKQRSAIQGPALVFVKNSQEGHFLVIRPVGHTGHLVQVLDGERPPIVIDADRLLASPSWTGLALVPHRPNPLVPVAITILVVCTTALALRLWSRSQGTPLNVMSLAATFLPSITRRRSQSPQAGLDPRV